MVLSFSSSQFNVDSIQFNKSVDVTVIIIVLISSDGVSAVNITSLSNSS